MKKNGFFLTGEEVKNEPYHYRTAGLEGIYLLNGFTKEEIDGEEYVSITDVEGLHKAIGRHIVLFRKALSPQDVRFLRNTMDLTQADLADLLGNTSQSVARWEKGETDIPGASEKLLRVVFLASILTEAELAALRELAVTRLAELDSMEDGTAIKAQFELFDCWTKKAA